MHETFGHIGTNQITSKLKEMYYFKGMNKMTREMCKRCLTCNKNKSRRTSKRLGLLSRLGPATRPLEILSIDTVGGFNNNNSSKKYMHILVDHFSRYCWISTSKRQNAEEFVKLLSPVIEGNEEKVKILLVDQYSGLNSKALKEYCKNKEIRLIYTSVDHPSSNGLNERLNQTLVNRLRCKRYQNEKTAWTKLAEECVEEYNNTKHSSTGFEPNYLLFGESKTIGPIELVDRRDLEKDRREAIKNSQDGHLVNKERLDKNRQDEEFHVGDLVYVDSGHKLNRNKLDVIREGPYLILERVSKSMYRIDRDRKKKEANLVHINKLQRYSF